MNYKQDRQPERFEFAKAFMSDTLCMLEEWFCGGHFVLSKGLCTQKVHTCMHCRLCNHDISR